MDKNILRQKSNLDYLKIRQNPTMEIAQIELKIDITEVSIMGMIVVMAKFKYILNI